MENNIQNVPDLQKKANRSFILWIIGMIAWIIPIIGLPIQIFGLVFGIKGTKLEKSWKATAGIILCIIGLVFSIINASIWAYMWATGQHKVVNQLLKK